MVDNACHTWHVEGVTDSELVARGALELLSGDDTLTYEEACLLAAIILGA